MISHTPGVNLDSRFRRNDGEMISHTPGANLLGIDRYHICICYGYATFFFYAGLSLTAVTLMELIIRYHNTQLSPHLYNRAGNATARIMFLAL